MLTYLYNHKSTTMQLRAKFIKSDIFKLKISFYRIGAQNKYYHYRSKIKWKKCVLIFYKFVLKNKLNICKLIFNDG